MNYGDQPLFYQSLLLFSDEDMETITRSTVGIVGIGGVGSIATEMIARTGVGNMRVSDPDAYQPYNLNRQVFATIDTVGHNKAATAAQKIMLINPSLNVTVLLPTSTAMDAGLDLAALPNTIGPSMPSSIASTRPGFSATV